MRYVVIALISFCVCFDLVPSISIAGEVLSLANHVQIEDACDFESEKKVLMNLIDYKNIKIRIDNTEILLSETKTDDLIKTF